MVTFLVLAVNMLLQYRIITTMTLVLMMMMKMITRVDNKKILATIADTATPKSTWTTSIKKKKKVSK